MFLDWSVALFSATMMVYLWLLCHTGNICYRNATAGYWIDIVKSLSYIFKRNITILYFDRISSSKLVYLIFKVIAQAINTQVPRYLLFCEGGISSAVALGGYKAYTLYRDNVVYIAMKFVKFTLQVNNTQKVFFAFNIHLTFKWHEMDRL